MDQPAQRQWPIDIQTRLRISWMFLWRFILLICLLGFVFGRLLPTGVGIPPIDVGLTVLQVLAVPAPSLLAFKWMLVDRRPMVRLGATPAATGWRSVVGIWWSFLWRWVLLSLVVAGLAASAIGLLVVFLIGAAWTPTATAIVGTLSLYGATVYVVGFVLPGREGFEVMRPSGS